MEAINKQDALFNLESDLSRTVAGVSGASSWLEADTLKELYTNSGGQLGELGIALQDVEAK